MYDVIVIGSGGAGLTAALAAADTGARVLVLEASSRWGGSTAVSAGEVWTPLNHRMGELGISDSAEDALRYCLSNASGRCSEVVEAFVHAAPRMARFVEARSPIVWRAMHSPDSLAEQSGGRHAGRHLEVAPLAAGDLESMQDNFWLPTFPAIFTNDEVFKLRLLLGGEWPEALAQKRTRDGYVCNGVGLIVGLMQGCRALDVQFERNTRVRRLFCRAGHKVDGVIIERDGEEVVIHANNGVVLASGGFEWNETWRDSALSGQPTHPVSPPLHFGDGQRLVSDVGGVLAHMDESWSWPAQDVVDQVWPGTQTPRHDLILRERCLPHVIWVDRKGQRFVNESSHNCALAFASLASTSVAHSPRSEHPPAWAIVDSQFRSRYPFAGAAPGGDLPEQVIQAPSLDSLAQATGIDGVGLRQTIERFNQMVVGGRDLDFQRGEAAYDRYYGDPEAAHPNLGSIAQAPFYAMPVRAGLVGTKGGASTDERARVLDVRAQPLGGLWAAGNAMASIIGPGTIAPGLTLGLALTWGFIAGQDAGNDSTNNGADGTR